MQMGVWADFFRVAVLRVKAPKMLAVAPPPGEFLGDFSHSGQSPEPLGDDT
ncbi:hypothetical protein Pla123a_00330 [Posidoniimonas polymericola]|uniref:Uncharacterized protein n=1 Tax=Posidoniimonas polymericola TaxID=2528002 RepID=A0A5C5ZDS8_9BACT|nr:hypothetical protein Pla123a_00330 [Posidoniimonas polymericola]